MNLKNIQLLINMIGEKSTGYPAEIGLKLGVTERMVYKYLDILKSEFKAPIKYNRAKKTYYFSEEGLINLNWQDEKLVKNKINDVGQKG